MVVDAVCKAFNCEEKNILAKGLNKNVARDKAILVSRDLTGESNVHSGEYFGGISGAAITMRSNYLARLLQTNSPIKNKVKRIKNTY